MSRNVSTRFNSLPARAANRRATRAARIETAQFTTENHDGASMDGYTFEDKLELFGTLGGAFLIIMGLVALASTPWATTESTAAVLIQVLGILIVFALAVAMIGFTYADDASNLLPGDENAE